MHPEADVAQTANWLDSSAATVAVSTSAVARTIQRQPVGVPPPTSSALTGEAPAVVRPVRLEIRRRVGASWHKAQSTALNTVKTPAVRQILIWWAASRVIVVVSAVAVQASGWPSRGWSPSLSRYPLELLATWDGRWYRTIAHRGYLLIPGHQSDPAFFPLLPILERVVHAAGVSLTIGGIVLANLGFLAGAFIFYALSKELLPERDALRTVIYLTIFPVSYVFSMAYPEGIVLPAMAAAALCAIRGRWLVCAACVFVATLGRPEGVVLVIPIAAILAKKWHRLPLADRAKGLTAALAGPLAILTFMGYLWSATGDAFAWNKAERIWGRSFQLRGLYSAGVELMAMPRHHNYWLLRDAVFVAVYVVLLLVALRARIPWYWVLAGAVTVLLPLWSGSVQSDARFGLLSFAAIWGLAVVGRHRAADWFVRIAGPALLVAAVVTIPLRFP